jgi:hypothetical protein
MPPPINHNSYSYDWNKLLVSQLWSDLISEWKALLENTALKENDYHSFLKKHPAIFFCISGSYLAISKMKMGAQYETDFVIVEEGYSNGTLYELIEIESPHTNLFNKNGAPSSKLNQALQQIRDWRRYLKDNRSFFLKTFPTTTTRIDTDSKLRFKIIIGRRTTNKDELAKRAQIEDENNVEIWSFDRLTDLIIGRGYFHKTARIYAAQTESLPDYLLNELANPFFICASDSEWREICKKGKSHIYYHLIDDIIRIRKYNEYYEKFKTLQMPS